MGVDTVAEQELVEDAVPPGLDRRTGVGEGRTDQGASAVATTRSSSPVSRRRSGSGSVPRNFRQRDLARPPNTRLEVSVHGVQDALEERTIRGFVGGASPGAYDDQLAVVRCRPGECETGGPSSRDRPSTWRRQPSTGSNGRFPPAAGKPVPKAPCQAAARTRAESMTTSPVPKITTRRE
ncbi:hypothetical protein [Streptomyces sp. NPDC015350]|uniref:hypothetical protein n=1 Tax=Streptomyces sp. NPDC015350 TaxID=3364955 RepID=UPI0037028849